MREEIKIFEETALESELAGKEFFEAVNEVATWPEDKWRAFLSARLGDKSPPDWVYFLLKVMNKRNQPKQEKRDENV